MANRTTGAFEAARLAREQLRALGRELRVARMTSGGRQLDVARVVGISTAHVSRIEHGLAPGVTYRTLASVASAVGMRLWVRAYPAGRRLLDAPQLRLLGLLWNQCHESWSCQTEVPVPIDGASGRCGAPQRIL